MDETIFQQAKEWANYYRIFSNERRILIVWALSEREFSVGELAETIHASLQSTSQYLRSMKDCGFVESRREGQTVYYKIADHPFFDDCAFLRQLRSTKPIQPYKEKHHV